MSLTECPTTPPRPLSNRERLALAELEAFAIRWIRDNGDNLPALADDLADVLSHVDDLRSSDLP